MKLYFNLNFNFNSCILYNKNFKLQFFNICFILNAFELLEINFFLKKDEIIFKKFIEANLNLFFVLFIFQTM